MKMDDESEVVVGVVAGSVQPHRNTSNLNFGMWVQPSPNQREDFCVVGVVEIVRNDDLQIQKTDQMAQPLLAKMGENQTQKNNR